jgi:AcrR family transcriptional regulator
LRHQVLARDTGTLGLISWRIMPREKSPAKEEGGLPRLPPGRHGLPREFVVRNQRDRIAAGMIAVVVEGGFAAATVTQVVTAAGLSRRSFYNYYSDKEEAFVDVYHQVIGFLLAAMGEAGEAETGGWAARVRAELEALLGCYAANPDLAHFTLEAPPAAGGEIAGLYREFLERLLVVIGEGRPKRAKQPPRAAEYGLVGGLAALVVEAVKTDGAAGLAPLLPEVVELVLTPYLGREEAIRAAR